MSLNRRSALALLGALAGSVAGIGSLALAAHRRGHCCPDCGHKTCCPTPVTIKEKKHCFEVECKDVCIPAVKGPFAPCCEPPPCGRVRTVNVLKKVEYECERCGYKWHVSTVQGCCK